MKIVSIYLAYKSTSHTIGLSLSAEAKRVQGGISLQSIQTGNPNWQLTLAIHTGNRQHEE